jgi:hypothetical protein
VSQSIRVVMSHTLTGTTDTRRTAPDRARSETRV